MLNHTPVVMLVFNRPAKTRRVLEAVAAAQPSQLLVVADGPRPDRPEDERVCAETRSLFDHLGWPCEVRTDFAEVNLGCRQRILSGLDWVFSQVTEAIVLEDDCLPEPSFFPYCEEMLARYRDDERVHLVRGGHFFRDGRPGGRSYHFSRWYHTWGWATWARAWQCTDPEMRRWPELRDSEWLSERLKLPQMVDIAKGHFDDAYHRRVTTWEYHFTFGGWSRDALAICPERNLVTNIGFDSDAAHYTSAGHPHALLPTAPLRFPLRHPREVAVDEEADMLEWSLLHRRVEPWLSRQRVTGALRRRVPWLAGHRAN